MLYIASFSELWERFSFYIVEALLVVYLIDSKELSQTYSYQLLGTYISNSFMLTIMGSYFGQNIIGYKNGVHLGAFLMAIGYALLLDPYYEFLYHGLALISIGSAFFKPNMACFVGSLYKIKSGHAYKAAYNLYYGLIMFGIILSTSISGYILETWGWYENFALASTSMCFAFLVFYFGNQLKPGIQYTPPLKRHQPIFQIALTLSTVLLLWWILNYILIHPQWATYEIILILLTMFFYLVYQYRCLRQEERKNFLACLVLMFCACIYWSLLFQLFFSLNLLVKLFVNRQFFQIEIPAPFFMGLESAFVILFSFLFSCWHRKPAAEPSSFLHFAAAFFACFIGFGVLLLALNTNQKPYFTWICCAYGFIGLGEAILAPTALAMIAQLNKKEHLGMMMAILYVFWGYGTKLADYLAQFSIYPPSLHSASAVLPYFHHGILLYALIALGMSCFAFLGHYIYTIFNFSCNKFMN